MATLAEQLTVRNLTPPGYFNQAEASPEASKNYLLWWNNILSDRVTQNELLRQLILTPWLFEFPDTPRNPWVQYLLTSYGFAFFVGTNTQAAALYKLVSGAWYISSIQNFTRILQALSMPPFEWFDADFIPRVTAGSFVPAISDTGFVAYTSDGGAAQPANTPYVARGWAAPVGWTRRPSSAVQYVRGYLVGSTITWCAKRSVSTDFSLPVFFSADVPLAVAAAGTLCIVNDDGTGDFKTVYYSDGSAWRKNSTTNPDLGLVIPETVRPVPEAITVYAPNPATAGYAISSEFPPPSDGNTAGYGTFAAYSGTAVFSGRLTVRAKLLVDDPTAIATLIAVLRRVKPVSFVLELKVTLPDTSINTYIVSDAREAPL